MNILSPTNEMNKVCSIKNDIILFHFDDLVNCSCLHVFRWPAM